MELDKSIVDEMESVDWYTLSERESQNLGSSIGTFQDALTNHNTQKDTMIMSLITLIGSAFVITLCYFLHSGAVAILCGVCAVIVTSFLFTLLSTKLAKSIVMIHKDSLIADIKSLAKLHPVPPKKQLLKETSKSTKAEREID